MNQQITVIGLGAGDLDQLPYGVYKKLTKNHDKLFLRTKEHPAVAELEQEGYTFQSFDSIYEKHSTFEEVYEEICSTLLSEAEHQPIVYAVPGHPLVAEFTVQLLLKRAPMLGISIEIGGGQSFLDAIFQALKIDPVEGFELLDGTALTRDDFNPRTHTVIGQVYDQFVASEVKLTLMEKLPDDYEVMIVTAAGSKGEKLRSVPLYELDRGMEVDNLTSVYVPPVRDDKLLYREFSTLRKIISDLRGPEGCPWDKKQSHMSLKKYLIEEAYELIDAINSDDIDNMIEELGDVLLQVMLHAQIGDDEGFFAIEDVIECLSEKMVRRHPHVFGNATAENEEEVLQNWQEIKQKEKGNEKGKKSLLEDSGKGLPGLLKAFQLQKEAAKTGFDWPDIAPVIAKVREEIEEFSAETRKTDNFSELELEFGDMLFALVNVGRHYKIDPEEALFKANQKFIRRFAHIEKRVEESGKPFSEFSLDELDEFWNEAKKFGF
ncbi:nucleoside triphosphate pyrophosphohydrolase [Mesobacillus zeae]|uniref:Nucleoside triphosphate pyrophosphohydrolase n=1 Tax=Mesobacillus zeae TaxID=1917180 RepID=A0A398BHZ3_9BACI|nr:nucleoside triphosphate pyrophosphohydrolase [Mesobacillus zeae]RID88651.1 nucleoside triphosphate pyrophosphohydrolase [Mesobacillus zeae]